MAAINLFASGMPDWRNIRPPWPSNSRVSGTNRTPNSRATRRPMALSKSRRMTSIWLPARASIPLTMEFAARQAVHKGAWNWIRMGLPWRNRFSRAAKESSFVCAG